MNVMQRLNEAIKKKGSVIVAGLDPKWRDILNVFKGEYVDLNVVSKYCSDYIDSVCDIVPAIKINVAFFEEMCCAETVFVEVAHYAKEKGLFVIADAKRADIGSTSEAYAQAFLGENSPFDAITVNPYFGTDGVKPFLDLAKKNNKGVFVLVKTSNKSSVELQDLKIADGTDRFVYEVVADMVKEWGEYTNQENEEYSLVGAVVGATHPEQAEELRKRLPNTFFLVPGYGAQGATAKDVVVNFDKDGLGAIVNSSRGIMQAYKSERWKNQYSEETWKEAYTDEARRATQEINQALQEK